jgi:type VI secretion system protein ImpL
MKSTFLKVLKISLIVLAAILAVLLVFGLVLILNWPFWMGFFLLLILIGLIFVFLFARKIWLRQQEQHFVQQVIEQDESHLKNLTGKEKDDLKELQDRWKEAIEVLRRSHLKKMGNPLYALPWYLVMGESGSGKTTAIQSAKLSSPFLEVRRTSGISGTRNCDWWFFEQAIVIDTAGRYAIPVDEGRDKEEWQRFLDLLVKYRKKEPIHGLIVTIAADKMLQAGREALEEDGRAIRRRINELMRVLGVRFPVYVLVTKCDLIQGLTQFCDRLPEKALDQPMGFVNQEISLDVAGLVERAFTTLGERLRNLRILLLHHRDTKEVNPGLLIFPEEFESLKQGLESFMKAAFQENPYQETPILRGLFFSSGRQEGMPYSHFLKALGLIGEKEVLPGTSSGLFLHDFFAKILPQDRGLFTPTKRTIEWRILTRNLGLTAWVVFGVVVCGLLSLSFVKNLKAVQEARQEFSSPLTLRGDMTADLITMDRFKRAALRVESQNRNWWVPRFGLNESKRVEMGLKNRYCNQFQNVFLATFDKQMSSVMAGLNTTTPDEVVGENISYLVRRINLLKARLDGQSFQTLQTMPQPSYTPVLFRADQKTVPEVRNQFGELYLYYVLWRLHPEEIQKEMILLQAWLKDLLTVKRGNLHWLVPWENRQGSIPFITLQDFWGGSQIAQNEIAISPSFSRKGKNQIDGFLRELESALPDPIILAVQKQEFEKWYPIVYFEAWQNFASIFPRGTERLKGVKEWQPMAARMATDQSPHFVFLNRIAFELEPVVRGELPPWLQATYQFQLIKNLGKAGPVPGILGKVAESGRKMIGAYEKKSGQEAGGKTLDDQLSAAKAFQEYQSALSALTPLSTSRTQAYQLVSQGYSEEPATGKSPFFAAYRAINQMKNTLGKGRATEEIFWRIISGPVDALWTFGRNETACYLQNQWEEKVLVETMGATDQQAIQILLGQDGHAWKFLKGTAGPFIGRNLQRGYYAKEVLGGTIPIEGAFFTFLNKGAQAQAAAVTKQSYSVTIRGLPTDTNIEARIKPHSTRLELQCASGPQSLVNHNYPVAKTFSWNPETCVDVLFQIEVGDNVLTKKYQGIQAFSDFLKDFRGGRRTFSTDEFPGEKTALVKLGIRNIRVNYQFSGADQILSQTKTIPGQAPRMMVKCWEK